MKWGVDPLEIHGRGIIKGIGWMNYNAIYCDGRHLVIIMFRGLESLKAILDMLILKCLLDI